jgi:hypothetical protein
MNDLPRVIKITGPLLVFGGPYSNLEATAAILAEACRRAIPSGNILCTGDLAAYCADRRLSLIWCAAHRSRW